MSRTCKNEVSRAARLRKRLRDCVGLSAWAVFEDFATLRRRLEAEGNSGQGINDQLRSDLAIDRLCRSTLSVDEIGAELGLHGASAPLRAFRRWIGLQPGECRKRRLRWPEVVA